MTPPTPGAMRAARAINTSHEDSLTEDIMARIIDAETGKDREELVKALQEMVNVTEGEELDRAMKGDDVRFCNARDDAERLLRRHALHAAAKETKDDR